MIRRYGFSADAADWFLCSHIIQNTRSRLASGAFLYFFKAML